METGKITSKAMLAALHISMWSARRFDKKATKEVADWHGASETVGRYNKSLLPDNAESYKAITSIACAARKSFYTQTLPWMDSGARILPAMNWLEFGKAMKVHEDAFNAALQPFFDQYGFLKVHAQRTLNGLYREEDYPDRSALKELFAFSVDFFPIPNAADFRVEIQQEDVDDIRKQIEEKVQSSVKDAMDEPYRRLFDGVAHMAARLSGAKTCLCRACKGKSYETNTFSDSTIDNVAELCQILPRLNLTGDNGLDLMIQEVKTGLLGFKPDAIRDSTIVRNTLAERAAEISRNLAGYMKVA